MPRVVVGAGVLGASVAHRLAQAGARVTVIEAGGPAAGTSSATFSIDVSHLKTPQHPPAEARLPRRDPGHPRCRSAADARRAGRLDLVAGAPCCRRMRR
ncbi:FAD-dependent oxidoreductase [Streptomyces sp. NPDC057136]|uniref:FAD-dependent oxidoreductase n=1 Tax=Streptomyces sp. NPDC057136 TaxID=3346029 RepID=UPI00363189D0